MTENGTWIYLYSSSARPLYRQAATTTIALPSGWVEHFRYEKEIVAPTLWDLVERSTGPTRTRSVAGKRTLVCYLNQKKEGDRWQVLGRWPLRTGIVQSAELDGDILHIWFHVGSYCDYPGDPKHDLPPEQRLEESTKNVSAAYYAFCGPAWKGHTIKSDGPHGSQAFQHLVDTLTGTAGLSGKATPFIRFDGIYKVGRGEEEQRRVQIDNSAIRQSVYQLQEETAYELRCSFYSPEELASGVFDKASLKIGHDSSVTFISSPEVRLSDRRYDLFSFRFTPHRNSSNSWTLLEVMTDPGKGADDPSDSEEQKRQLAEFVGCEWIISAQITLQAWPRLVYGLSEILFIGATGAFAVLKGVNDTSPLWVVALGVSILSAVARLSMSLRGFSAKT